MSDLHEFEADFLQRVIAKGKRKRHLVYQSETTPSQEIGAEDKRTADNLKKRGLVDINYGCGQWNTVVVITDKGYSALAEHLADERMARAEQMKYCDDLREVVDSLLDVLHDQAQRIAELELRA